MADGRLDSKKALAAEAAREMELSETDAWNDLAVLSNNTLVDSLEVFEDEIVFDGETFMGPLLWHVTLQYGGGDDAFTSSDSFPGKFSGEFQGGKAIISEMTADTSSFYE